MHNYSLTTILQKYPQNLKDVRACIANLNLFSFTVVKLLYRPIIWKIKKTGQDLFSGNPGSVLPNLSLR